MDPKFYFLMFLRSMPSAFGFIVRTPENAVVGIVGGQVVLDCQLVPAELPANVEVRWNRLKLGEPVHLYREGKDQPTLQDLSYAHRTELYKSQFRNGNVSLLIKQLTVQDEGVYSCQVASGQERKDNKVMLKIAAVGLNPVIQLTGHRGSMVELGCTSKGWYPEPKVMWLDGHKEELRKRGGTENKVEMKRMEFYEVNSSAVVMQESQNIFSCVIRNDLLNSMKGVTVQISGQFFPSVCGWLSAFWVIFVLFLLAILLAVYLVWRLRKLVLVNKELKKRPSVNEYEELQRKLEKERAESDQGLQTLLHQIDTEREEAAKERKRLQNIIDWDQMLRRAVDVTLDPDSANGQLLLSRDLKSVKDAGTFKDVADSPWRFERYPFVTGKVSYARGRQYWEVDVETCTNWDLGVVSDTADRKGKMALDESGGYWAIGRYWDKFEAKATERVLITAMTIPARIGVYLDLEAGSLSFFDSGLRRLLHSYKIPSNQESFFPVFCPWGSGEPLTIVPVVTD